jgi:hypothetical protein
MTLARKHRLLTVILSLWALLFAQVALAGYVCPASGKAVQVAAMAEAGMPCAETMSKAMDDEQPGLCHAHCQSSQQASDTYQAPHLATLAELGAVLTVEPAQPRANVPRRAPPRPNASPPLAIAHCCFRI